MPLSPCGMVMDYLRSAYSTMVWAVDPASGLMTQTQIRWYRCAGGALPFPSVHRYASANWTRGVAYPEQVGEVIGAARPWSNASRNPAASGLGHCPGDYTAAPTLLTSPRPTNSFDMPACCPTPSGCEAWNLGGITIDLGDGAGPRPMVHVNPSTWTLTLDAWATEGWMVKTGVALCSGGRKRVGVFRTSGPPANPADQQLFLATSGNPLSAGSWYEPLSSPYSPGHTVVLTS